MTPIDRSTHEHPSGPGAQLATILEERHRLPLPPSIDGRPTVALLGADVPRTLVAAAGATPVRLFPTLLSTDLPSIDLLAAGVGAPLAIDHSSEANASLAQSLAGAAGSLANEGGPTVWFVDLLHGDGVAVVEHRRRTRTRLLARLAGLTGEAPSHEALAAATSCERTRRAQLQALLAHRTSTRPTVSGSLALTALRASETADGPATRALLADAIAQAIARTEDGSPIEHEARGFVVGPAPVDYRALERDGVHVVGEDHDEGALLVTDPLADGTGGVRSLRRATPERRLRAIEHAAIERGADTLVVAADDDVTAWLLPALRRMAVRHDWRLVEREVER